LCSRSPTRRVSGCPRIIGELWKLGITKISRQTVRNILKEEEIQAGGAGTEERLLERFHPTARRDALGGRLLLGEDGNGLRDMYVMVFLCLQTREVFVTESVLPQREREFWPM